MKYLILLLLISCENKTFYLNERVKLSKNNFYEKACPYGVIKEKTLGEVYYVDLYLEGNLSICPIDTKIIRVEDLIKIKENNGNDK